MPPPLQRRGSPRPAAVDSPDSRGPADATHTPSPPGWPEHIRKTKGPPRGEFRTPFYHSMDPAPARAPVQPTGRPGRICHRIMSSVRSYTQPLAPAPPCPDERRNMGKTNKNDARLGKAGPLSPEPSLRADPAAARALERRRPPLAPRSSTGHGRVRTQRKLTCWVLFVRIAGATAPPVAVGRASCFEE